MGVFRRDSHGSVLVVGTSFLWLLLPREQADSRCSVLSQNSSSTSRRPDLLAQAPQSGCWLVHPSRERVGRRQVWSVQMNFGDQRRNYSENYVGCWEAWAGSSASRLSGGTRPSCHLLCGPPRLCLPGSALLPWIPVGPHLVEPLLLFCFFSLPVAFSDLGSTRQLLASL